MHNREALPRTKFLVVNGDVQLRQEADKAVLDSKLVGTPAEEKERATVRGGK
jgi:hypothetical protein